MHGPMPSSDLGPTEPLLVDRQNDECNIGAMRYISGQALALNPNGAPLGAMNLAPARSEALALSVLA